MVYNIRSAQLMMRGVDKGLKGGMQLNAVRAVDPEDSLVKHDVALEEF